MRFGWLMALLAGVMAAAPAWAVTWVKYSFTGNGFYSVTQGDGSILNTPVKLSGYFTAEIDPVDLGTGSYPYFYLADGKTFAYNDGSTAFTSSGTGGSLSFDAQCYSHGCFSGSLRAAFGGDTGIPGFVTTIPPGPVTGTVSYSTYSLADQWLYYGNIATLTAMIVGGDEGTVVFGSPVPEPATWAMMIVGFAMIGAARRKRSQRDVLARI